MRCFNLYDTQHDFSVPFNSDRIHHPHLRSQPQINLRELTCQRNAIALSQCHQLSCNHTK
ncbi:hypothetical protein [Coleofasciculus sp. FACHB-1120]|uniref:hypothetical protein n=1 Tax=Coleofasciculus sp. FACHB-1120 TaxID=2692783 RepID=UPI0016864A0F|nr:hypothetical protein [Coleofasciculus sp. FACHB-1120]MBD2742337.1 hypothetical protein [Coleofasciculus sp. FACHB-1120]